MTAPAISHSGNWKFLSFLFKALAPASRHRQAPATPGEETLHEREFILEMMQSHPEAFQSDLDVQYVMQGCFSRF